MASRFTARAYRYAARLGCLAFGATCAMRCSIVSKISRSSVYSASSASRSAGLPRSFATDAYSRKRWCIPSKIPIESARRPAEHGRSLGSRWRNLLGYRNIGVAVAVQIDDVKEESNHKRNATRRVSEVRRQPSREEREVRRGRARCGALAHREAHGTRPHAWRGRGSRPQRYQGRRRRRVGPAGMIAGPLL